MSSVLLYNAVKTNFAYQQSTAQAGAVASGCAAGTIAGQLAGAAVGATAGIAGIVACLQNSPAQVGFSGLTNTDTWKFIPRMSGATGGFKVCDTSGYYRCGAACSWTVPAGVSCAEFQIWGPGAGTGSNCCCGGSPFGPTGAYAVVAIPVTPGQVYTLCAGCAYCCYATQTTPGLIGSPSYVTGTGLTNFCATSGASCVCNWRASLAAQQIGQYCYPGGSGCMFPSGFLNCGPQSCSGWNFCWDNVIYDTVRMLDYSFSCETKFCGTATSGTVYGISGMYPRFNVGTINGLCGWMQAAPVYGFENVSQCIICFCGATCSGCNYSPLFGGTPMMLNPGSGGAGGPVNGGCNACGGDSGRMGMVCVSYK